MHFDPALPARLNASTPRRLNASTPQHLEILSSNRVMRVDENLGPIQNVRMWATMALISSSVSRFSQAGMVAIFPMAAPPFLMIATR